MYFKKLTFLLGIFFSFGAFAQTNIDSLVSEGDLLTLSLVDNKTHILPSCVINGNIEQWTINITTDEGRAALILINLAMSSGYSLQLESADDCINGIERIKNITLLTE